MDVLVVGGNGLLGSAVVAAAQARSHTVSLTYHSSAPAFDVPATQLDVRETDEFVDTLEATAPDVVVNCAAMTDVDGCESAREPAFAVNAEAPGAMATACATRDVAFVHVSTDYVFDGESRTPYPEMAATNPVQVYGASKAAGDRRVLETDADALVARLSFVYGRRGDTGTLEGFPAWVDETLSAGEPVPLFTDQWVTPSRVGAAAPAILDLVEASVRGVVNVASRSCVTPYELGTLVANQREYDAALLQEGSMDDLDRPAERPVYSCLDTTLVSRLLEREPPTVEADLRSVL